MFDKRWEEDVYGKGRHLNRYPFDDVVSFIFNNVPSPANRRAMSVLEVGSGAGNNLWFLSREGFRTSGIEGSETAVKVARERLDAEKLEADIRVGDFTVLPWEDETFDIVIDRESITHNTRRDIERAFAEVYRTLKPGGLFLSVLFSTEHASASLGVDEGDGSIADFRAGYFADIARTFFASGSDIDAFFTKFRIEKKLASRMIDQDGNAVSATWKVWARKP